MKPKRKRKVIKKVKVATSNTEIPNQMDCINAVINQLEQIEMKPHYVAYIDENSGKLVELFTGTKQK